MGRLDPIVPEDVQLLQKILEQVKLLREDLVNLIASSQEETARRNISGGNESISDRETSESGSKS